jgi:hypothetical protein
VERVVEGTLSEVNAVAATLDRQLARRVAGEEEGAVQIDGLVTVSCDVDTVNHKTIMAAARRGIPVVGTGGTSLGRMAAMGVSVVGSSGGSVSTTVQSRALSCASSLAGHWGHTYEPSPLSISLHGVLAGAWPAVLTVAVARKAGTDFVQPLLLDRLSHIPWLGSRLAPEQTAPTLPDLSAALPLLLAVVASAHVAKLGETALMAGVLAGALACGGGGHTILTGLLTGVMAGWLCRRLLVGLARTNMVPATAAAILTAGVAGLAAGVLGLVLREPCRLVALGLHALLDRLEAPRADGKLSLFHGVVGGAVGAAMAWGSQVGLYHRLFLPLIILEMERGAPSFLGAVDWCCLCLSSGGICLAAWILPPPPAAFPSGGAVPVAITVDPRPLARRGVYINLFWGDFVEACYPFLAIPVIQAAYYIAGVASTGLLLSGGVKTSAYLPALVSLWLAQPADATPAALIAFGVPFGATLLLSLFHRVF